MYEVFTRGFSPGGDFTGVIAGLDRIQSAGAGVVSLMPIQSVGAPNRKAAPRSARSGSDHRAINPDYGTEADFRRLVREVHRRGMKIIIDWMPGYPARGSDVAAIDYRNPGMRRALIEEMKYWLDRYDVDGFRIDEAGLGADDFWREALPALRAGRRPLILLAESADPRVHELGFDLSYGVHGYGKLKAVWTGEPAASFVEQELHEKLPNQGRRLRFTTNHESAWDQPPPVLFGGIDGARAAFVAMAFLPGVPMLYNGQEWEQLNAATAPSFYRRVLDLATSHPAFVGGELQPIVTDAPTDVIAYTRGDVVVLVNTRPRAIDIRVHGHLLRGSRDLIYGTVQAGDVVKLGPYGTAVLDPRRR